MKVSFKLNIKHKIKSWHLAPLQTEGEKLEVGQIPSSWYLRSLQMVTATMKSEGVFFWAGKR